MLLAATSNQSELMNNTKPSCRARIRYSESIELLGKYRLTPGAIRRGVLWEMSPDWIKGQPRTVPTKTGDPVCISVFEMGRKACQQGLEKVQPESHFTGVARNIPKWPRLHFQKSYSAHELLGKGIVRETSQDTQSLRKGLSSLTVKVGVIGSYLGFSSDLNFARDSSW